MENDIKNVEQTNNNEAKTYTDPVTGKFVPGNPGGGRPKGSLNFKTEFELALKEFAKKLKEEKGEDRSLDDLKREILMRGFMEARKGDFSFYKDIVDRLFGKAPDVVEVEGGLFTADKLVITTYEQEKQRQQQEQENSKDEGTKPDSEQQAETGA